jgi:hypothetical protein
MRIPTPPARSTLLSEATITYLRIYNRSIRHDNL